MDAFKSGVMKCCDVGGLGCTCCNPTLSNSGKRNSKQLLRRNARAKLKAQDTKEKEAVDGLEA
jgi:hypothetical protein